MAETGMEADLASLRARVSQIEQDGEIKNKEWAKLGLISLWFAIGLFVYGIALGSIDLLYTHSLGPMWLAPMYVIIPLIILNRMLFVTRAGRRRGDQSQPPMLCESR